MKPKNVQWKPISTNSNEIHVQYFYDGVSFLAVEEGCRLESVTS